MSKSEEPSSEAKSEREMELERVLAEQDEHIARLTEQIMSRGTASKYSDDFIPILLKHVGIDGKSYGSLPFKLGIGTVHTLYNWEKRYPQWKRAKEMANNGRLGVLEDTLLGLASGKIKGNAAAAIFYAKNAAPDDFKDKREIEMGGNVTYVIDTGIPMKQLPVEEILEAEFDIIDQAEDEPEEPMEDLL